MPAELIDGVAIAKRVRARVAGEAAALKASEGITPGLTVVLVGDDPASAVYVASKEKACKEAGESKVILTALCGHGHLDLAAYEQFLAGEMVDYELPDAAIAAAMAEVPTLA